MNLFEISFGSDVLDQRTQINVLLPEAEVKSRSKHKTKTLYLLHGYSGDHSDWLRKSNIEEYARYYDLAIVMPNGHNSFYANMTHGRQYLKHVAEEIPNFIQDSFNLSAAREDTFIAGLSMGGYGAFKIALKYPERFSAASSLSGVLDIQYSIDQNRDHTESRFYPPLTFAYGEKGEVAGTENDIRWLLEETNKLKEKPRLFQCCGTEDELYENNLRIRDLAQTLSYDYTYEEGPGIHNWAYWDANIQRTLQWLGLEQFPE